MSAPPSDDAPLLPVSALNSYVYCPRLFHLSWVQREWSDNAATLDGRRVHRRVDRPSRQFDASDDDDPPVTLRSLGLSDRTLGLTATIDLVELNEDTRVAVPVEYKRGAVPPSGDAYPPETIQVCAQALLLRAHGYRCERAVVYYAASRRRVALDITDGLVERTLHLRDAALAAANQEHPPPPLIDSPKCPGCSLVGICLPDEHNHLTSSGTAVRRIVPSADDAQPLHLTAQGAKVGKDGRELVITPRDGDPTRLRLMNIASVHVHGQIQITTGALRALMSAGVPVAYYNQGSWYYGRSTGHDHKNITIRIAQFTAALDEARCLEIARRIVGAKIWNCRVFLRRNRRDGDDDVLSDLAQRHREAARAERKETLLGVEGLAARSYFGALSQVMSPDLEGDFDFTQRNRRPPKDPVNALLSFAYALLTSAWTHTLTCVGLDPYLGFYHAPRYGRPALSLDLMEEFRPTIADSIVVSVLNRGHITASDFERAAGSVALRPAGKKRFIAAFERRLDEQIRHPIFGYRMSYRRIFEVQARLLCRYLSGEIESYPELKPR